MSNETPGQTGLSTDEILQLALAHARSLTHEQRQEAYALAKAQIEAEAILARVYVDVNEGLILKALHALSFQVDDWLTNGDAGPVDALFQYADVRRLGVSGCVALLTDTEQIRGFFPRRGGFLSRTTDLIRETLPTETASALILGIR